MQCSMHANAHTHVTTPVSWDCVQTQGFEAKVRGDTMHKI